AATGAPNHPHLHCRNPRYGDAGRDCDCTRLHSAGHPVQGDRMPRRTVLAGSLGIAAGAATSLPFLVPRYDRDRRPARSRVAVLPAIDYSEKLATLLW